MKNISKIPTARQFLVNNCDTHGSYKHNEFWADYVTPDILIEFAKLHVEAALKAAADNARINRKPTGEGETSDEEISISFYGDLGYEDYIPVEYTIDISSIQEAYPLTNIK